jgi:arylformamidase
LTTDAKIETIRTMTARRFWAIIFVGLIGALTVLSAAMISAQQFGSNSIVGNPIYRNIPYAHFPGDTNKDELDIYLPSRGKDWPVLVLIHGGSWNGGDKASVGFIKQKVGTLTDAGFAVVSINYRLHPTANGLEQANDCAAAISWLKRNISSYGADPERIGLLGYSAGGQIALLLATDEGLLARHGLSHADIKATVTLDAVGLNIPAAILDKEGYLKTSYQKVFGSSRAQKAASPYWRLKDADNLAQLLLIYTGQYAQIPRQHEEFAQKLDKLGASYELLRAKSKDHRTIDSDFGNPSEEITQKTLEFLKEKL